MRSILLFALIAIMVVSPSPSSAAPAPSATQPAPETKEQKDARMKWWREARFGMFIHWGLYAVPAGTWQDKQISGIGEWIMLRGKIPVADYAKFANDFTAAKYDPDAWVRAAKDAGMKYIIITSKHHDGFALFDSKVTDWDVVDRTPAKRDLLKPLAEACQKHGVKLGFYYSQAQDWYHPGGAAMNVEPWDPAQKGSMDDYIKNVAVPQVKEILSNYGPLAVLWWDTPVNMTRERALPFLPLLDLQPGIITNNRLGGGFQGDTETPEQYIPATGYPGRDFEVCMTMNDTWGFKSYDENWKSTETLVRNLIDIASKGGNYLLNVGPTKEGEIPQPSLDRLKQIGEWLDKNGEAIYATSASPFRRYSFDGRVTMKGEDKMFVHVFAWKDGKATIAGMKTPVKSAKFLVGGETAKTEAGKDENGATTLTIAAPSQPDPIATVVELDLAGPVEVEKVQLVIGPDSDKRLRLVAAEATINGNKLALENHNTNLGFWSEMSEFPSWDIDAKVPGDYDVDLSYAVAPDSAGSEFEIVAGDSVARGKTEDTGGWDVYKRTKIGRLTLKEGKQTVTVKPTNKPGQAVMNFKEIRLTPVKKPQQ